MKTLCMNLLCRVYDACIRIGGRRCWRGLLNIFCRVLDIIRKNVILKAKVEVCVEDSEKGNC